jgi:hypothetical protein
VNWDWSVVAVKEVEKEERGLWGGGEEGRSMFCE